MGKSYLPAALSDRIAWLQNFSVQMGVQGTNLGFTSAEKSAIAAAVTGADEAVTAHRSIQDSARAAKAVQDAAVDAALALVRPAVRRIQASPGASNAVRAEFDITIPDDSRTPVPVPSAQPIGRVDAADPLAHTVAFFSAEDPSRRARPDGVDGVEVYFAVGAEPAGPEQMAIAGIAKGEPFAKQFASADAGKRAWYRGRYFNPRGERGPWGPMTSATIAA